MRDCPLNVGLGEAALPAELGWRGRGGLARQVGDEPDADQRLDAEIPPGGAASRLRYSPKNSWPSRAHLSARTALSATSMALCS
jgi:hypothetical protein